MLGWLILSWVLKASTHSSAFVSTQPPTKEGRAVLAIAIKVAIGLGIFAWFCDYMFQRTQKRRQWNK